MAIHMVNLCSAGVQRVTLKGLVTIQIKVFILKKCWHTFQDYLSEFGESEMSETSRLSYDGREDDIVRSVSKLWRSSLSLISLPVEDFMKQKPGWPLLQIASSVTQPTLVAREMLVMQWVMNLRLTSPISVPISTTARAAERFSAYTR